MWMTPKQRFTFPNFTEYMAKEFPKLALVKSVVKNMEKHGKLTPAEFRKVVLWGNAPQIVVTHLRKAVKCGSSVSNVGCTRNAHWIEIDHQVVVDFEVDKLNLGRRKTARGGKVYFAAVTVLHELCHWGHKFKKIAEVGEAGNEFEKATYGKVIYY